MVWWDAIRIEYALIKHRLREHTLLYRVFLLLLVVLALLVIGFVGARLLAGVAIDDLLLSAKGFAPFVIIGLIVLEVVFAPLPGTFIIVAAGALFGVWLGALYSYIGNVLGSLLAFFLAQRFGRPLVEKLASKKLLERYDGFFQRYKHMIFIFYCLPIIPVDILSFSCGLSDMRWRKFVLVMGLGFIPNILLLSFAGQVMAGLSVILMIVYVLVLLLVLSLLAWLSRLVIARLQRRSMHQKKS